MQYYNGSWERWRCIVTLTKSFKSGTEQIIIGVCGDMDNSLSTIHGGERTPKLNLHLHRLY